MYLEQNTISSNTKGCGNSLTSRDTTKSCLPKNVSFLIQQRKLSVLRKLLNLDCQKNADKIIQKTFQTISRMLVSKYSP